MHTDFQNSFVPRSGFAGQGSFGTTAGGAGPAVPVNTVAPAITGTEQVSFVLSCSTGSWSNSPTSYARQWKRNGTNIGGATASTYTLVSADVGAAITCAVTATNAVGSSTPALSNATGAIINLPPVNTVAPVAAAPSGVVVGSLLGSGTGTWTNSPTSYAYQWLRDGVTIFGATANTYTTVQADVGAEISFRLRATNSGGFADADSNTVGPIEQMAAPVNTVAPAVTGTNYVDGLLSCDTGTWTSLVTPTYAYQWRLNGSNISGANSSTYAPAAGDSAGSVDCVVTASNAGGNVDAASNAVTIDARQQELITVAVDTGRDTDGAAVKFFDGSGGRVFWFSIARREVDALECSLASGASFVTGTAGLYFNINVNGVDSYLWFQTGTESDPAVGASGLQVNVSALANAQDIANAVAAVMGTGAVVDGSTTRVVYTNPTLGAVSALGINTTPIGISQIAIGADGAGAPSNDPSPFTSQHRVNGEENATAATLTTALLAAITAAISGSSIDITASSPASDQVRVRNITVGYRNSPAEYGFPGSISTELTGAP